MVFRLFFLGVTLLLFSCKDNSNALHSNNEKKEEQISVDQLLVSTPKSLTLSEYLDFLKKMKGFSFDERETEQVYINLLYKPQQVEAALSVNEADPESSYEKLLEQKSGYYYFLINFLDKNPSVTGNKPSKKEFLDTLRSSIVVTRNEANPQIENIIEVVPSSVAGQPDQLILLVPEEKTDRMIQVTIPGQAFGVRDVAIKFSTAQLKRFPDLKL